jgi:hypothetical protein
MIYNPAFSEMADVDYSTVKTALFTRRRFDPYLQAAGFLNKRSQILCFGDIAFMTFLLQG